MIQKESLELYRITFDWDNKHTSKKIRKKGIKAQVIKSNGDFKNSFGNYEMYPGGKYYWELKLTYGVHFMIGVMREEEISKEDLALKVDKNSPFFSKQGGFAYYSQGYLRAKGINISPKSEYGEPYSMGDTIGVLLDMKKGTLSFSKNGKMFGPAFVNNALKNDVYLPAVGMLIDGETVEVRLD
jgi:hypothetical protein